MLVSIITPCLDPGDRLERCVASVRAQRGAGVDVEHIVVDGGSTDGTVERLSRMHDVTWSSERDTGPAQAINRGFACANGEVLGWLGADDEFLDGSVRASLSALATRPDAGWTHGTVKVVENGRRWTHRARRDISRRTLEYQNPVSQPGSLLRRSAIERIGSLDESLQLAFDVDLWVRLVDAGIPTVRVRVPLARFEIHSTSKSGSESVAAWLFEDIELRRKVGWYRGAAFHAGRLAAHRSAGGSAALAEAIDNELRARDLVGDDLREVAFAGARLDAALLAPTLWQRARALARPTLWVRPEVRQLMATRIEHHARTRFARPVSR